MLEGESDIERIREFTDRKVIWCPNYIFEKNIPEQLPLRSSKEIGICHFGRITKDKGVDIVLDTFELLAEKYPMLKLYIIGGIGGVGGGDPIFYENFNKRCKESKYAERITRIGQSPSEYLKKVMDKCHFFLFPTADPCEGQSNSLNEAMAQGLIPIVSDFHFNRAIVDNDKLVIKGYNPADYAAAIENIIDSKEINTLSENVWKRIKNDFAYKIVNERISNEIRNIK